MQKKRKPQNQGRHAKCSEEGRKRQKIDIPTSQMQLSFRNGNNKLKNGRNSTTDSRRKAKISRREKCDASGSEDGSEIDSDEAFGESDEERFEGFTFRGSSSFSHKLADVNDGLDNSEGLEDADSGSEYGSEESFNGIDEEPLTFGSDHEIEADLRDSRNESQIHSVNAKKIDGSGMGAFKLGSRQSEINLSEFSDLDTSEGEVDDERTVTQLHDLIKSMPVDEGEKAKPARSVGAIEMLPPSDHHILSSQKISLQDLIPTISSTSLKNSLKQLAQDSRLERHGVKRLEAPLPKRQQDRLNRLAANQKAKETLNRWVDTVKQNRRADHMSFPLEPEDKDLSQHVPSIQRDFYRTPATNLEATIDTILHENGLKGKGADSEKDLQLLETSEVQKLPLEEALARKARLRKMRDLLFREEIRAKRLKKIKSKAYRRVHRNERKIELANTLSSLNYADHNIDDEKERLDRLRAEQRMSVKHRDSKWARDARNSGRAFWDKEIQVAMSELGERQEQLRRRIEGKSAHGAQEEWAKSFSDSDSDSDSASNGDIGDEQTNDRSLKNVGDGATNMLLKALDMSGNKANNYKKSSALDQLTQRANKDIRTENDKQACQLREELVSGEVSLDADDKDTARVGRRKFNAKQNRFNSTALQNKKQEFEEVEASEASEASERPEQPISQIPTSGSGSESHPKSMVQKPGNYRVPPLKNSLSSSLRHKEKKNPWLTQLPKQKTGRKLDSLDSDSDSFGSSNEVNEQSIEAQDVLVSSKIEQVKANEAIKPKILESQIVANINRDSEDEEHEGGILMKNQELINEAFAGDGVLKHFEKEKKAVETDEADQKVDESLPGWGSWIGDGISKKSLRRNQGKHTVKVNGVQRDKRKDAKLDRVIINERRVRKNAKYLATSLPHPYETKGQYEKSLRLPVGREWSTNENFLNATKPRVLMKPNTIIQPLRAPMV